MPDQDPFAKSSADHLRLVIETGRIGIWELDLQSGAAIRNPRHDQIFGYPDLLDEWTYDMFLDHVVEADRQKVDDLQRAAIETEQPWEFECRILRCDGKERWISAAGCPLRGRSGRIEKLIGHVIDISRTKEREARLALITQELNHRVRNMLTVIRSMVTLTARKANDIPSFAKSLEGRVEALARSHKLLIAEGSVSMAPSDILNAELEAFPDLRDRTRISAENEPTLSGAAGQGLALIFHELITNAIKHGAFSMEGGQVEVRIRGLERSTCIEWKERGGPEVKRPARAGFGSTLMKRASGSNGKVRLDYQSDGLECEILLQRDEPSRRTEDAVTEDA